MLNHIYESDECVPVSAMINIIALSDDTLQRDFLKYLESFAERQNLLTEDQLNLLRAMSPKFAGLLKQCAPSSDL